MILKWRGKQYKFKPTSIESGRDKTGVGAKVTINCNIYAMDTESVETAKRYEPQCFQISSPFDGEELVYLPPQTYALRTFIEFFVEKYSWREV